MKDIRSLSKEERTQIGKFQTIQNLLNFEKYLKRQKITPYIKKNILFRFHEIFQEEMRETESGKKWESKLK